jgi:hypothetical protein
MLPQSALAPQLFDALVHDRLARFGLRTILCAKEEPTDHVTVDHLAETLQEPNRPWLRQVLRVLGYDRTAALLADALRCEAAGGMLTHDGTRRRTPGGVCFQLVREQASPKDRGRLFPRSTPPPFHAQAPASPEGPPQAPLQELTWDEVSLIMQTLATAPAGEARTMTVTLIGRPGQVETRQTCVVFRMQGKPPGNFPKGLPPVPAEPPMTWTVMVALRQWNRVKDSVTTHQDDHLIIEGYPLMQGTQSVLLAQSCASLRQQRAQKQAQQVAVQGHASEASR